MELPAHLVGLYRHWNLHTRPHDSGKYIAPTDIFSDPNLYTKISHFVRDRIDIWKKKTRGDTPPFTTDPILSTYRFCNIFREFDRQTIEFHTLLKPLENDFPRWLLNMFYCRLVARPETIRAAGLLSFDENENNQLYERLMNSSRPRFGTPYVFPVSTIQKSETPTRELFITQYLPKIMTVIAAEISSWRKKSVHDGVARILPLFGFDLHFLWTEVLIDVVYQFPERLDLFAQFPIGPGSAPTMQAINSVADPSLLVTELARLNFDSGLTVNGTPLRLSAENWEGIGCEFRKYTNLKVGKGRRRLYRP